MKPTPQPIPTGEKRKIIKELLKVWNEYVAYKIDSIPADNTPSGSYVDLKNWVISRFCSFEDFMEYISNL